MISGLLNICQNIKHRITVHKIPLDIITVNRYNI